MGGAEAVLDRAAAARADGDYRWAAQLLNHLVFADPANQAARTQQADTFEQLGYQSEAGPWRNFYLLVRRNSVTRSGLSQAAVAPC